MKRREVKEELQALLKSSYQIIDSEADLEKMMAHGLSATRLLRPALHQKDSIKFVDYLIAKGGDLTKIHYVASDLALEVYQDLINKGLNPRAFA